jgi:hypothetical protein
MYLNFTQIADNYSLVFIIFNNIFWTTKRDESNKYFFLVSCPKGQVKKNVNVEACFENC